MITKERVLDVFTPFVGVNKLTPTQWYGITSQLLNDDVHPDKSMRMDGICYPCYIAPQFLSRYYRVDNITVIRFECMHIVSILELILDLNTNFRTMVWELVNFRKQLKSRHTNISDIIKLYINQIYGMLSGGSSIVSGNDVKSAMIKAFTTMAIISNIITDMGGDVVYIDTDEIHVYFANDELKNDIISEVNRYITNRSVQSIDTYGMRDVIYLKKKTYVSVNAGEFRGVRSYTTPEVSSEIIKNYWSTFMSKYEE